MKLAVTHSQKVPGAVEYSSELFSAMIEVEIPEEAGRDAKAVQGWLRELYAQAKTSVEEQIKSVPRRNGNGTGGQSASGIFSRPDNGPDRPPHRGNGGGNGGRTASPKQISFLVSLGARNRLTFADLQRMAEERFRVDDLYQLTKGDASALIDELKGEGARR